LLWGAGTLAWARTQCKNPSTLAEPTGKDVADQCWTGYSEFPCEMLRPPRSLAGRTFTDIRRWSVMPRGGHFAAMEQPDALAQELREFFRPLRDR
jgi:hypothetical protein